MVTTGGATASAGAKGESKIGAANVGTTAASVSAALRELSALAAKLADELGDPVERAGRMIVESMRSGGKLLACGNGGSAADAQHFVAELLGHMSRERQSLPAVTLSVDPSAMTAIGNDYGYEYVFSRQVEGLGRRGDVLLAISTSGRSANVLHAIEAARSKRMGVIVLSGKGGDPTLEECDVCFHIPSPSTQRVQELHMAVLHAICEYIDDQAVSGGLVSDGTTQSRG